jgi:hypothetical protein
LRGLHWKICALHGQIGAHARASGPGTRRRDVTRTRVHVSPPCITVLWPGLKVWAWPRHALTSRASLGAASTGIAACHAACTRARGAVLAPTAHARRGSAPYRALMRRGALAAKRPHPRALSYKNLPLSLPRVSPCPPPQASIFLRSLPPPAKASNLFPRTQRSSHGRALIFPASSLAGTRAAAGALPPLAGATSGHATTTNQLRVRPIARLCRLFICPGPTSPPENSSPLLRAWMWTSRGISVNQGPYCNRSHLSFLTS